MELELYNRRPLPWWERVPEPLLDYWPALRPAPRLELAVAYRSSNSNTSTSGTSNPCPAPAGIQVGDILLMQIGWDTGTLTVPSGFTQVSAGEGTFSGWTQRVYFKVADSGDAAASTFTSTFSASAYSDVGMVALSGGHATTPIFGSTVNTTGGGTTATGTGINSTPAGSILVHFAVSSVGARSSGPSGMTNRVTYDTNIYIDSLDLTSGGNTGDKTSTYPTAQNYVVHMVVVQPSASGQTITHSGLASAEGFGSQTVSQQIQHAGLATGEAFGTHVVLNPQSVAPGGVPSGEAFGTQAVHQHIAHSGLPGAEAFGSHTVAGTSAQTINHQGLASAEAFGSQRADLLIRPQGSNYLRVSGRRFVNAYGKKRFVIGDAAWSLTIQLNTTDAATYFSDRRSRGFNAILVNSIEIGFGTDPPNNVNGDSPFTGTLGGGEPDFTTPRTSYWSHVLTLVRLAATYDLTVFLTPCYLGFGGGAEGWAAQLVANGETRARTYARFWASLFRGEPNLVIVMGGDWTPTGDALTFTNAMAEEIKAICPHLMTAHWAPQSLTSDVATFTDEDITAAYPGVSSVLPPSDIIRDGYDLAAALPVFDIETAYEDGIASPTRKAMREAAWGAYLEGAYGKFFGYGGEGAGSIWCFGSGYASNFGSPGTLDFQRFASFVNDHLSDDADLVPDQSNVLVTAGRGTAGTAGYVLAALSSDDKLAVCYLPDSETITVDMTEFSGTVRARWYDPTNGTYTFIANYANSGTQNFTPSGNNSAGAADWVLELTAGGHTLAHTIGPTGLATAEAEGSPTITQTGPQDVSPGGVASGEAEGTPAAHQHVVHAGLAGAEEFGAHSLILYLAPGSVGSGEGFGGHTIAAGDGTIQVPGLESAQNLGSVVVTGGESDDSRREILDIIIWTRGRP